MNQPQEPIDIDSWFRAWFEADVVACRGYRVDALQRAIIGQTRTTMFALDAAMCAYGMTARRRAAILAHAFTRITARADNDFAAELAERLCQLDPADVAYLLPTMTAHPGEQFGYVPHRFELPPASEVQ